MPTNANHEVDNSAKSSSEPRANRSYCSIPQVPAREFPAEIDPNRLLLILRTEKKWVNGTVLHYYFFDQETDGETVFFRDGTSEWRTWTTDEAQKDVVRRAFDTWKEIGIGLEFQEVTSRDEAEIRIGFMRGDGSWSYIGRDILDVGADKRTMNFGWDLTRPNEIDTAIHEIGHTLGFPHEHQNPNAGIVWDEEEVYAALAAPPNRWDRETTFYNIIRKVAPDTVQGSNWDPDSIMHYPFGAGLILKPEDYQEGIDPAPGLSARDKSWVKAYYPGLSRGDYTELKPFGSVELALNEGQQANFIVQSQNTRHYEIRTFGQSDTVMVLFEDESGDLRYRAGDDDSGENRNARIRTKLFKGRRYVLRIRLYHSNHSGEMAVMMW